MVSQFLNIFPTQLTSFGTVAMLQEFRVIFRCAKALEAPHIASANGNLHKSHRIDFTLDMRPCIWAFPPIPWILGLVLFCPVSSSLFSPHWHGPNFAALHCFCHSGHMSEWCEKKLKFLFWPPLRTQRPSMPKMRAFCKEIPPGHNPCPDPCIWLLNHLKYNFSIQKSSFWPSSIRCPSDAHKLQVRGHCRRTSRL